MNLISKWLRRLNNRLFAKPLVQYREVEDYQCKFCKKIFWHSFYKDICQACVKKGIEWAIRNAKHD